MCKRTEIEELKDQLSKLRTELREMKLVCGLPEAKTEMEQIKEEMDYIKMSLSKLHDVECEKYKTGTEKLRVQRIRFNGALMNVLYEYLNAHPELRFGQALRNLKFLQTMEVEGHLLDPYYEEPYDTYARYLTTVPGSAERYRVYGPKL
jgi:hypothetical protein